MPSNFWTTGARTLKYRSRGGELLKAILSGGIRVQGKIDLAKKKLGRNCIFELSQPGQTSPDAIMYCLSEETRIFVEAIGISKSWRSSILLLISNNENTLYKYKIIQNITIEEEKTTTGKVLFSVAKVSRITTWLENFAAKLKIQMRSYNFTLSTKFNDIPLSLWVLLSAENY